MNGMNSWYNPGGYFATPEDFFRKEQEKFNLKKVGFYTGVAIIGNILVQNLLSVVLAVSGLMDKYLYDSVFSTGFDIFFTILALLVPFALCGKQMAKYSSVPRVFYLGGAYRKNLMLPAIIGGVGCCMGANIVTSYISIIFNNFGYEPSDIEFSLPDGIGGVILSLFRVAIVAGIVEEIALRGYALGNLRYYGDKFAIIMSSVVFGVIHGNFSQIPFALLSAFGLGYFSVKTGTMWTGVIIHIINNAVSVAFYYIPDLVGEEASIGLQLILIYTMIAAGIIATVVFCNKTKDIPLYRGGSILETGEKVKAYFLNVPMLFSIGYFLVISVLGTTKIS